MNFNTMTEICRLSISNGELENDYAFYTDGTVIHEYDDKEPFRTTVDQITVADIDGLLKCKY